MLINCKKVLARIHVKDCQIEPEAMLAIEAKLDAFIAKLCTQFNGHHKRITSELVILTKL